MSRSLRMIVFLCGVFGASRSQTLTAQSQTVFQTKDIGPGSASNLQRYFADGNGTLFFDASNGVNGIELWKSDGTEIGTVMIKDINDGTGSGFGHSSPNGFTFMNGSMFFAAHDGIHDEELWKSDGTEAGTVMVKDIGSGGVPGPDELTDVEGTLFFTTYGPGSGTELWKSDGSDAGTKLVKDIRSGTNSSEPRDLTNVDGMLFFHAFEPPNGRPLWVSDGTTAGTKRVKIFDGDLAPRNLASFHGMLFFSADDGAKGHELWKSNGTGIGTELVKDINAGTLASFPSELTRFRGMLVFSAYSSSTGRELWKSDGTAAGTVLVKDIHPGSASSEANNLVVVGDVLYFAAVDPTHGQELWKSDGTAAGTELVKDIKPGTGSGLGVDSFFSYPTNVRGTVHFAADDGVHGTELWRSDGTDEGTSMVADIDPGSEGALDHQRAYGLGAAGDFLYFLADDGVTGLELWATDLIFKDGFERGDLLAWSSNVNGGGDLKVSAAAAMEGAFGLEALIDDASAIFVQDDTPNGEHRNRARFLFNPHDLSVAPEGSAADASASDGARVQIFGLYTQNGKRALATIALHALNGKYYLSAKAREDNRSSRETRLVQITSGEHMVELDWIRSSGPTTFDGELELFVDGISTGRLVGLDNDLRGAGTARLGVLLAPASTRGSIYFDFFESRRSRFVGQ